MENSFDNIFTGIKILGLAVAGFIVWKLLNKFNILGTSKATEEAQKLGTDKTFSDSVTNNLKQEDNPFKIAIEKKFGKHPTDTQMKSLLPNYNNFPHWVTSINFDVHKTLTRNKVGIIFNVYKSMYSQYEIDFFNTLFGAVVKEDAYSRLDKLMSDTDMEKLRDMINLKPLI